MGKSHIGKYRHYGSLYIFVSSLKMITMYRLYFLALLLICLAGCQDATQLAGNEPVETVMVDETEYEVTTVDGST
ncbi:MAG: hypothetical protein AAF597_01305, partial [Bacteroidota bacterium]